MFMYEYARAGDLSSHYTPHYKLCAAIHARNYIGNLRPAFNNALHTRCRVATFSNRGSSLLILIIRIGRNVKILMETYVRNYLRIV